MLKNETSAMHVRDSLNSGTAQLCDKVCVWVRGQDLQHREESDNQDCLSDECDSAHSSPLIP